MSSDLLSRLAAVKGEADGDAEAREDYRAYVAGRVADGWTEEDVAEYKAEVGRIMAEGSDDEKAAAREFWASKRLPVGVEAGVERRIRASIAADKREAA